MGILKDSNQQETPGSAKRRSRQPDFSNLSPLKPGGGAGFFKFRDSTEDGPTAKKNRKTEDDMDSDDDDDDDLIPVKTEDEDVKVEDRRLSPDDIKRQGELSEGIRKIGVSVPHRLMASVLTRQLKRQHSSEPMDSSKTNSTATPVSGGTPPASSHLSTTPPNASVTSGETAQSNAVNGDLFGSPLKKQRASVSETKDTPLKVKIEEGVTGNIGEILGSASESSKTHATTSGLFGENIKPQGPAAPQQDVDEEL